MLYSRLYQKVNCTSRPYSLYNYQISLNVFKNYESTSKANALCQMSINKSEILFGVKLYNRKVNQTPCLNYLKCVFFKNKIKNKMN